MALEPEIQFREPTAVEGALLHRLLEASFPGRSELAALLRNVLVRIIDENGGSLTLLVKGVFLLRKSSEGLGLSEQELVKLSDPAVRKALPPLPTQAAQVVQDFGTGALLSNSRGKRSPRAMTVGPSQASTTLSCTASELARYG